MPPFKRPFEGFLHLRSLISQLESLVPCDYAQRGRPASRGGTPCRHVVMRNWGRQFHPTTTPTGLVPTTDVETPSNRFICEVMSVFVDIPSCRPLTPSNPNRRTDAGAPKSATFGESSMHISSRAISTARVRDFEERSPTKLLVYARRKSSCANDRSGGLIDRARRGWG